MAMEKADSLHEAADDMLNSIVDRYAKTKAYEKEVRYGKIRKNIRRGLGDDIYHNIRWENLEGKDGIAFLYKGVNIAIVEVWSGNGMKYELWQGLHLSETREFDDLRNAFLSLLVQIRTASEG